MKTGQFNPVTLRREMESMMAKIGRIAENKQMSIDDLNQFLSSHQKMDEIDDAYDEMVGGDLSPRERAQEVVFDAHEAALPKDRRRLARKALEVYPDCVDAYGILAGETQNEEEAIALYRKALEAGRRDLGEEFFSENEGHFWGMLETRPYMRAKFFLGRALWDIGKRDESVQHYQDCIRLNPNDNQGVRYVLLSCLLSRNDLEAVEKLLRQYKDDGGAEWSYGKALYYFKKFGPESKRAEKQLSEAIENNPHIPTYLLGKKKMPRHLPDVMAMGSPEEAVAYVADGLEVWKTTPGALKWLGHQLERP